MIDPLSLLYRSAPANKGQIVTPEQLKKKKQNSESALQTKICKELKKRYPGLIFFSDFAAGLHLPMQTAVVRSNQACEGKFLDLTILCPKGGYHGLIIEIKCQESDLFLVDGMTLKSDHVREQYDMIERLRTLGYAADFGVGYEETMNTIIEYMNGCVRYKKIIYRR